MYVSPSLSIEYLLPSFSSRIPFDHMISGLGFPVMVHVNLALLFSIANTALSGCTNSGGVGAANDYKKHASTNQSK